MKSLISQPKHPRELVNRILDQPDLPAIIPRLDPGVLTALIRHVGLENSAPIISLATAGQLSRVFDEDLWHSEAPGRPEAFDAERFGLWLEIMVETGAASAARTVMELDEDLVTLGLSRLVWVTGSEDRSLLIGYDRPSEYNDIIDSTLHQEFGRYLVIARNDMSWDAVCTLLVELNECDDDMLVRLLERCRRISEENMEDRGGHGTVLTAGETIEEDVGADREGRREDKGFVTPSSAAVFLNQARLVPVKEIMAAETMDFATLAYLTSSERETAAAARSRTPDQSSDAGATVSHDLKIVHFIQTLRDAEVLPASDHPMLPHEEAQSRDHHVPLAHAMHDISRMDPVLYSRRLTELSYLSNILISGCGFRGRTFLPNEAAEAAVSVCNLGSEYLLKSEADPEEIRPIDPMTALVNEHHLVKLFQLGWNILFDTVVLFTAKAVANFINCLADETTDPEQASELTCLAAGLHSCISSGRPWDMHDHLGSLLFFLDAETTIAITDLVREYPTLSHVICQKGGHRLSPFIQSRTEIETIQEFLRQVLPGA